MHLEKVIAGYKEHREGITNKTRFQISKSNRSQIFKIKVTMKKNVGKIDKIIRIVLSILIIAFGVIEQSWWGLVGAGIILPAIMGSDPIYPLIGLNTNKS